MTEIKHTNLVYATLPTRSLLLDLYLPGQGSQAPFPLIIWIHGGAWLMGDKSWCSPSPLVERGFAVASIDYRLSQEAIFPAQIMDCKAAVRWLRAHAQEYHLAPQRFGAWGDSAGGHLVAMLGVTGGVTELEGEVGNNLEQSSRVQAVCDWYGPSDLLRMGDVPGSVDHNAPDAPEAKLVGGPVQQRPDLAAYASPITYVRADAPPFLIMHGEMDDVVIPSQSVLLAQALQAAGVDVTLKMFPGKGHTFLGEEAVQSVGTFFEQHLGSPSK